jgi:hypothetical protein
VNTVFAYKFHRVVREEMATLSGPTWQEDARSLSNMGSLTDNAMP